MSAAEQGAEAALTSALLPFRFCERHQLPRSYERSLRVEAGQLLANRFILGIPAQRLNRSCFADLLATLAFPDAGLHATLQQQLLRASTLYLGFSQSAEGHTRRLYFEYWEEVEQRLRASLSSAANPDTSWPQGVGYKWDPQSPGSLRRTLYVIEPGLSCNAILNRCRHHLEQANEATAWHGLLPVIEAIVNGNPNIHPVFLEASEGSSARASFDLCLHRYSIDMGSLWAPLLPLFERLLPTGDLERLQQLWPACNLATHLSAGRSSAGTPYICLYSQQEE